MKKLLIIFILFALAQFSFAKERTLDERCDNHTMYIMELIKNKYKGESLAEQLELVEEWDDPVYREEIKVTLKEIIYKQPVFYTENEIARQALENYIAAYRICIKKYAKN